MLIELHARMGAAQKSLQGCFAQLDRRPPQILTGELKEIEGAKRDSPCLPLLLNRRRRRARSATTTQWIKSATAPT